VLRRRLDRPAVGVKAVVCQNAELAVDELPDPAPVEGQVLLQTLRCGICGSDLHARTGTDEWADMAVRGGYHRFGRSHERIVFGHEFCGEVAEYGPGSKRAIPTGTPVTALPLIRNGDSIDPVGLSSHAPGGYAEQVLVQQSLMLPVPNGLRPEIATLTEPMAVGWHAVRRADVKKKTVSVVIGCGPVGLAVILLLKARGVRTVIASDYSPARRQLAARCGADVVVDPAEESPYEQLTGRDLLEDMPSALELAVGSVEKLDRLPVDWWHVWRLGERLGLAEPKHPVIFECVGVPGVLEGIIDAAPLFSRVVVVGVCVGPDTFTPAMAINKEIDLRFVVAYTPLEFRDTLRMLAEGVVDPSPLVTGSVGLEGVDAAFTALADPERHAKILVDPRSQATEPA
jgi:threonine dehydrogenase-like Zn-dependent dehydrogenase